MAKQTNIRRRKKKNHRFLKFTVILMALILIIGVGIFSLYSYALGIFSQLNYEKLDERKLAIDNSVEEELKDYENIVLMGIDVRKGQDPEKSRTDAIVLVSINKKTNSVILTSIMRDTYLYMREGDEDRLDKLTHAHAYGGPENTIKTLNKNLDLNIRRYVRLDWKNVADLVDSMGGIKINIKDYEIDEMNKYIKDTNRSLHGSNKIIKKAGIQNLNGVQAVTYCRIRHAGNGDEERTLRMRRTIKALFKKAKTLDVRQLEEAANKVLPAIRTNLESQELVKYAAKAASYKIRKGESWPYDCAGTKVYGVWYNVPVTLKSNVVKLHEGIFKQKNYIPTNQIDYISDEIIKVTGIDTIY